MAGRSCSSHRTDTSCSGSRRCRRRLNDNDGFQNRYDLHECDGNAQYRFKSLNMIEGELGLEGEEYLGCVVSGRMLRAGGIAGYGIYVTTQRIIGAKSRKALWKGLRARPLVESREHSWARNSPEIRTRR